LDGAITHFKKALTYYKQIKLMLSQTEMEMNLGNIFNMKGEHKNAERHWNKSLVLNKKIGNLDQEANLLLNYGIYYYDNLKFDKAIKNYERANNIFTSLGKKNGEGIVLGNLGEVYLITCDYQKSYESLTKAKGLFQKLHNTLEELEVTFNLGLFYYILGDYNSLEEVLINMKNIIKQDNSLNRRDNDVNFLEQLLNISQNNLSETIEPLKSIKNLYFENEERNKFIMANDILCKSLIILNKADIAKQILMNKKNQILYLQLNIILRLIKLLKMKQLQI
jgi:tetratricopeptide (TPR) repeat protein